MTDEHAVTRDDLVRCTVEVWDRYDTGSIDPQASGEVVDAVWLSTPIDGSEPHWHLVVIADV